MPDLRPPPPRSTGQVVAVEHRSEILAGNPLGDPAARVVHVYLPPGYDAQPDRRYPVLWNLAAFTSSGPAQVAWRNHGENLPGRLDRLIESGALPPVLCAFPDSYTALGGNQFVNSPAIGRYADYLCDELVALVDRTFRTIPESSARAVFGKSSGAFGALHLAMHRPGVFAAVASHAGDCGFDRVYLRDFPVCCDQLAGFDGDLEAFVRWFWRARRPGHRAFHALMTLCLAASYSPDSAAPLGLALPFNLRTCRLDPEIWSRWLAFDPVNAAPRYSEELKSLAALWIDAGDRDQYFIHYGTRELHEKLDESGIDHHFEEFEGTHSGIDWRFDHSLPWLLGKMQQGGRLNPD